MSVYEDVETSAQGCSSSPLYTCNAFYLHTADGVRNPSVVRKSGIQSCHDSCLLLTRQRRCQIAAEQCDGNCAAGGGSRRRRRNLQRCMNHSSYTQNICFSSINVLFWHTKMGLIGVQKLTFAEARITLQSPCGSCKGLFLH